MEKQKRKIVHVHFIAGRKNRYYGSVSSLYRDYTSEDLGIGEESLRHYLTYDGCVYLNSKVMIIRDRLR